MKAKTVLALVAVAALGGCALFILGLCYIPLIDKMTDDLFRMYILPTKGSESFQAWKNWSRYKPIYRHFYFFHVLNPKGIVKTGKNRSVKELGPYVYRVDLERRDVSFAGNGSTLSYRLYRKYSFERELSVGNESDVITVVNLPILNLATRLRFSGRKVRACMKKQLKRYGGVGEGGLFSNVTVSDVIWGYRNNLMDELSRRCNATLSNDSTYGLMYQGGQPRRMTYDGEFETSTDLRNLWKVTKWNGKSSLDVWKSHSVCNELKGTDGYSWPPRVAQSSYSLPLFDPEWCRSLQIVSGVKKRRQRTKQISGIRTVVYSLSGDCFTKTKENRCYCQPLPTPPGKTNYTNCLERGVVNVTTCKDNVPIVLSQPHFLGAAKAYRKINGLKTNSTQHSTTFHIEPLTGELIEGSRKIQLNAYVFHLSSFPETKMQPKPGLPFPIVWTKEDYFMTDSEKTSLKRNVIGRKLFYDVMPYLLIAFGSCLVILPIGGFVCFVCRRRRQSYKSFEGENRPLLW